jgi:hypothetical protein
VHFHLIDYLPKQIYPGKITIIRAGEELADDPNKDLIAGDCEDSSLGWSEFSTEPVEIRTRKSCLDYGGTPCPDFSRRVKSLP